MNTRLYAPADYPTVSDWWGWHETEVVPEHVLPALGVVASDNEGAAAAAWLYQDNSVPVAWVSWIVTRPGLSPLEAVRVLRVLMGAVEAVAIAQKRALLFTMTKRFGLQKWLEREGWLPNDTGSTQYFKSLPYGS